MPRLDARLKQVASWIHADTHADIGSDHGHLLAALLSAKRIRHGIAVENKSQPFSNSTATLTGRNAEVRLGDGLSVIERGEIDSLSLCGMGGQSIVAILDAHPDRVPAEVIVQPNKAVEIVRRWGLRRSYWLADEASTNGKRRFEVLRFTRGNGELDPAYREINESIAVLFGPWFLRRRDEHLYHRLIEEQAYLLGKPNLTPSSRERLNRIKQALEVFEKKT